MLLSLPSNETLGNILQQNEALNIAKETMRVPE